MTAAFSARVRDALRNGSAGGYRGAVATEITLLGVPGVRRDGRPATFDTRKAMALLALLALGDRPRSREALCELLWPAHDPERARGSLRRTLSTLRTAIGEEWIDTAGDGVALRRGAGLEVDVDRFRALAAEGASAESLTEAVMLFSGGLLEGFTLRDSADFDNWQITEADTLRRELGSALRRLVDALAAQGAYEQAIPHASRWLEVDPMHEPAHRELIRLYAWSGDRVAALEQYRDCVRTLTQELGVAPLAETVALYEQVNEGSLVPPEPAQPASSARARVADAPPELPLVGREDDLAALVDAHVAAWPDGRLAVIEGEAGVGKTRLANELARTAEAAGAVVLSARCHDDEAGLPYGPIVELLRGALRHPGWPDRVSPQRLADASLLLPDLAGLRDDVPRALRLEGPGAHVRLLEAVADLLSAACDGPAPGVAFIDDVHGADEATLDAISYLGRRLRGRALVLVVTWRSERVPPGHRLRRLAVDLSREGAATIVRPARLDEREVAQLVEAAHPGGAAIDVGRIVYLESEGLPLFVAEYLAAASTDGEPAETGWATEVRGLLDARLAGLGGVERQVLGAAATIGRSFDLDTVREASGRGEEEAVEALEALVAHGIVREVPAAEPAYDFSHEKLRELVYAEVGLARRRLLHRRVAGALAKRIAAGEGAALVAQHLRLAGDNAEAAKRYEMAAAHAQTLHAHADALAHLDAALALGHPDTTALHERIGDLRTLVGDYTGAFASYESAAADGEPEALAAIEHKLGNLHERRGEWDRAEARLKAALDATPVENRGSQARIQADLSLMLHHAGRSAEATAPARESRALAEAAGDRRAQAQAHNMLGVLARGEGDTELARAQLGHSLALADELDDAPARAAALNNLALVSRDAGDLDGAVQLTSSALALCANYGDRHREAALENNLADLHHAAGRPDESMAHLKRAVAIFTEVGADEATRLPEIWKLVSW